MSTKFACDPELSFASLFLFLMHVLEIAVWVYPKAAMKFYIVELCRAVQTRDTFFGSVRTLLMYLCAIHCFFRRCGTTGEQ